MDLLIDQDRTDRRSIRRVWGRPGRRRGLGAAEVVVILAIACFFVLCVLIVLPRGRETARLAGCQRNLMQIGVAVQLYEQANQQYPASSLGAGGPEGVSPIRAMLMSLALPDFLDLRSPAEPIKPGTAPEINARVPGLTCPSDPDHRPDPAATAISYRANAGDDFAGTDGPFAPGTRVDAKMVEAADGASFTAGFAERLIGTGRDGEISRANYQQVPNPITAPCVAAEGSHARWHGDAGHSWADASWRSSLYNHAIPPAAIASCLAADGRTAAMTASSLHPGRINVWMLDGSIRGITPTINPAVWTALGSYRSPAATGPTSP